MTINRRLIPYRDLTTHYPTPATGNPGSAGWFRQAAHNLSNTMNAARIYGSGSVSGLVEFAPAWEGVTVSDVWGATAGYVQVGTICYLMAEASITEIGDTGLSLGSLPVPPADSVLPMHAGTGSIFDGAVTTLPIVGEVSGGGLTFYWAWTATDGRIIDADPMTISTLGLIKVCAQYRTAAPPKGYLSEFNHLIEAQEPV